MSAENDGTVIDIRGLNKAFGSTQALDGLDLTVVTGKVHGFLGPNGAGKSARDDSGGPWTRQARPHQRGESALEQSFDYG